MYLHLGQDTVVNMSDIIGIFDLDNTSVSKITKQYLSNAEKENTVVTVSAELPKSFIVCEKGGTKTIYISQISSGTLMKRAKNIGMSLK